MEIKGEYCVAKIHASIIDDVTKAQVEELMNQSFVTGSNVRIMPDCHAGVGCVIGTTMDVKDCCVPNLVGVDIGCGMLTVKLGKMKIELAKLDSYIIKNIPCGENVYNHTIDSNVDITKLYCYEALNHKKRLHSSIGTLGGGNHFIEIDIDEKNNLYLVIHTGSRNLGKQVCELYMKRAKNRLMDKMYSEIKNKVEYLKNNDKHNLIQSEIDKIKQKYDLINKSLIPLYGDDLKDYLHDMKICQDFAWENREAIATKILNYLGLKFNKSNHFHTVHNYINMNDMILRKGAISAYKNELVLIPINMRDGAIIGKGKGNADYNYSAPHGAGRILSRLKAKKELSLTDYKKSMKGIYSSCICFDTLDESPFVYKPIEEILPNITETVDVIKIIKPIYNFKAKE